MTNITQFVEFHDKRTLMTETYYELVQCLTLPPEFVKILKIMAFVLIGWLISVASVILMSPYLPLSTRKPNKDIFFAAYIEKIRKNFYCQNEETFKTILVGTNRVLRANTEDPTVFLMLVPRGAMPTAIRLVTLLVHCILLAYQLPASQQHVQRVISDGSKYTSHNDEWPLFYQLKRHLRFYGVAAVLSFESLHPQVVRTLQLLLPQVYSPNPESVLILVVDLKNRFTEHQKNNMSPNNLGRAFLLDHFGPYFDRAELMETVNRLGCRCVLVNAEPGYYNNI